jgi:hypothetical protein
MHLELFKNTKKFFQKNVNILLFIINPKGIKLPPFNTSQYNPISCILSFYNHLMAS